MTYSILAKDPKNGRFGVAVASVHLAVGSTVPHIRSGIGAVATQAHTNPYLGICGLERLENGDNAESVLASLLDDDQDRERRQFHLIDANGRTSGWTGQDCTGWANHLCDQNLSVAGNCLANNVVLERMQKTFLDSDPTWKLGRRLMKALLAGEHAGGDHRSERATSAAIQISGESAFPLLDLRIDFRNNAVDELSELYQRSQDQWAQQWRNELADLKTLNRFVA
ncbi:DUF1028 domain-containing protein [Synechococcus sp. MIT S1220]|uniref:DUF1028 domain-containing protein n=1 Tax=Synechococcus sp. MIT S1220 TaxID=3082549 RepID=UPI0039B01FA3